jgi:Anti-sigma-K factor rskA, C-terminal/Putative zinc-finger
MKGHEVHPDLTALVLGGLEPEEAEEARRHLASCSRCRNELEGLKKVNRALEAAPPPVDLPPYLKGEILSRLRAEKGSQDRAELEKRPSERQEDSSGESRFYRAVRPGVVLSGVAAAAVFAVVALGLFFGLQRAPVATIRLIPTPEEAAALHGYWGVAEIRPQPSDNQQVELRLNNFDEPEPDKYYELWFVSGDRRISAGSFTSVGRGETRVWLNAPPEARSFDTLLITEERLGSGAAAGEQVALEGEMP